MSRQGKASNTVLWKDLCLKDYPGVSQKRDLAKYTKFYFKMSVYP